MLGWACLLAWMSWGLKTWSVLTLLEVPPPQWQIRSVRWKYGFLLQLLLCRKSGELPAKLLSGGMCRESVLCDRAGATNA
jgi:hypothetical protein